MKSNTYGRYGVIKLHNQTNADLNWLHGQSVEAFPNGAKINPALKVQNVYAALVDNRRTGLALVKAIFETTPELGKAWMRHMGPSAQNSFAGVLQELASEIEARKAQTEPAVVKHLPRKQR